MARKKKLRSDVIVQSLVEATALGARLRELRDEAEISNAELARAMDVDESTLGQILAGDIERPPDHRLRGAARVLGVSFESLRRLVADSDGRLREAAVEGSKWSVRVIRAGVSDNGNGYPPAVLEAAVHLFEGAPVYAISDAEHVDRRDPPLSRDVSRMVGRIIEPRFVREGTGGEIRAVLDVINPAGDFGQWLREAVRRGMHKDTFGLSVSVMARRRRASKETREIVAVESVDFVVRPAAGGRILKLIESVEDSTVTRATNTNTEDREELLVEAVSQLETSGLPEAARKRLRKKLKKAKDLTEAAVGRLIDDERGYLAEVAPRGHVDLPDMGMFTGRSDGPAGGRIRVTEGRETKIKKMLDALLDPADKSVVSLREAYIELTGDKRVTGDMRNVERSRLSEAITVGTGAGAGVFAQVFGDSLTRRMQKLYNESMPIYDWYKKVCTEVPVMDFRTQRRVRWGGYGDLPTVVQGAAYAALTSPTDEEETYSATKKGGTEVITLESIKNDDVGVVMSIPRRLAMAAIRRRAR